MDYDQLVENLISQGQLKNSLLIEAFRNIKREDFVLSEYKEFAGQDAPLPIGEGQTISQPWTVAFVLELLEPGPGQKVLDVGSGSGWTSALLAFCVGKNGKVFAAERVSELCEFGKKNISRYTFIEQGIVEIFCGDASQGLPEQAPFDRILVSAAARELPEDLKKQLKIGGRLVIPVNNSIWLVVRRAENQFEEREFYGFSFVPLIKDK